MNFKITSLPNTPTSTATPTATKFTITNQAQPAPQSNVQQPQDTFLGGHPILKGISDVVGITGLAKGLTQSIFLNLTPEGRDVQKMLEQGKITPEQFDQIVGGGLATPKEVIGSGIQTAATIGTAGLGAPSASTALGRVAETGLKMGALSGLQGGAQSYGQGGNVGDIATQAAKSGAVGAGLGAAGQSISELATYLTSPHVTEGIYNKYIGIPKKVIEKGKAPTAEFQAQLGAGTKTGLLAKAQTIANDSEGQISNILAENAKTKPLQFSTANVRKQITDALQAQFPNTLGPEDVNAMVAKLPIEKLRTPGSVNVETLNALRKEIDNKFLGNAKWLNNTTSENVTALKTAANTLRGMVQSTDERLPPLYKTLSQAITTSRALNSDLAKPHALTNLLEILGSLLYGGATGGVTPEGIKNALESYAVARGVSSAPFGTGVARGLDVAGKIGGSTAAQTAAGLAKTLTPGIAKQVTSR